MAGTRIVRPEKANVVSALYCGAVEMSHWIIKFPPEYTTEGDAISVPVQTIRMYPVTFSSEELASLERASQAMPDPVFGGDDDL